MTLPAKPSLLEIRALMVAFWALICLVVSAALSACNTAEGFGKDVKAAGSAVEDAAADAHHH